MKGYFLTTKSGTEEFILNEFSTMSSLMLNSLKEKYNDDEKLLSKIKQKFELLYPRTYDLDVSSGKEKDLEDWWHSFICKISMQAYDIYIQSICEESRKADCYAPIILFILTFEGFQKTFGSIKLFEKEDAEFFVKEMNKAFEKDLVSKHKHVRITEMLSSQLSGKPIVPEDSEIYLFVKNVEKELASGKFEYIVYHDGDEHLNFSSMYTEFNDVRYTDLFLSKDFQKYIKDSNFSNDVFEDMDDLVNGYFEETESIDFLDEIVKEIKSDKESYKNNIMNESSLKEMKYSEKTMTIMDLLALDDDSELLNDYKRSI